MYSSHQDPDADTASDKEDDDKDMEDDDGEEASEKKLSRSGDLSSWVNLSMDMTEWEVLLKQLEDTVALSSLLHINIPTSEKKPGESEATKELVKVSVSKLLEGGRGME